MATTKKATTAKKAPAKKAPAAKKATAKPAAKKTTEPAAPKPKAGEVVLAGIAPQPKVRDSLNAIKNVRATNQGHVILMKANAQQVVDDITVAMREGVKADRGGFMYTEGKLRGVRTAIIAATNAVQPARATATAEPKETPKERADRLARAKAQGQKLAAWKKNGSKGRRPSTPDFDAVEAAYEAKQAKAS